MCRSSYLEKIVKEYKVFIDTCSILNESFGKFVVNIYPLLLKYKTNINLIAQVIIELKKKLKDPSLSSRAKTALETLTELSKMGLLKVYGDESESFADNVFLSQFTRLRLDYDILFITQDVNLAKDIKNNLNTLQSARGHLIRVRKLNMMGYLSEFADLSSSNNFYSKKETRVYTKITDVSNQLMKVSHVPGDGEVVYTKDKEKVYLVKKLAEGGEGKIYLISSQIDNQNQFVAKLYFESKITFRKIEQLKRIIAANLNSPSICTPLMLLYNSKGEAVGFLMRRAEGRELQRSIFVKPLLLKYFPNWTKLETVQLSLSILNKIEYLHKHNVLIGDINASNMLIKSPQEVYFVDTDSYQVEDFPCPVGSLIFTAPEIQGRKFDSFLRTEEQENYSVATLLFMIMMMGKQPYSTQNGGNIQENIKNMEFSFPLKESTNKRTPEGPWPYMWSHLPFKIKEAFYNTFKKGGKFASPQNRLSVSDWKRLFKDYLFLLKEGKLEAQDSMSLDLFPTRYKKIESIQYGRCVVCGKEFPVDRLKKTNICFDCSNKHYKVETCVGCNKKFVITYGEYLYFKDKNLDLPKRCKNCRDSKRSNRENEKRRPYMW